MRPGYREQEPAAGGPGDPPKPTIELPPPGDTAAEADFLQALEQRGSGLDAFPQQDLVAIGRSICERSAGGDTGEQVVEGLRDSSYEFTPEQSRVLVESAVEELCPDARPGA